MKTKNWLIYSRRRFILWKNHINFTFFDPYFLLLYFLAIRYILPNIIFSLLVSRPFYFSTNFLALFLIFGLLTFSLIFGSNQFKRIVRRSNGPLFVRAHFDRISNFICITYFRLIVEKNFGKTRKRLTFTHFSPLLFYLLKLIFIILRVAFYPA